MLEAIMSEKLSLLLLGVVCGAIVFFFNYHKKSKENCRIRTRLIDRIKKGGSNHKELANLSTEEIFDKFLNKQDKLIKNSIEKLEEANVKLLKLNDEKKELSVFNNKVLCTTQKFLSDVGFESEEETEVKNISDFERMLKSAICKNKNISGRLNHYHGELESNSDELENNKAKRLENLATIRAKNITLTNRLQTFDKTLDKHNSSLVKTIIKLDNETSNETGERKEDLAKKIKYLHTLKNVKEELKKSLKLIGALSHAEKEIETLKSKITSIEDMFIKEGSEEINKEQLKVILEEFRKCIIEVKSYQNEFEEHQNKYNESVEKIDLKERESLCDLSNLLNKKDTNDSKKLFSEIRADLGKSIYFNECLFEMIEQLINDSNFVTDIIEEEWQNKYQESVSVIEIKKNIHGLKLQFERLNKNETDYKVEDDDLDISDFQINEDGEIII